MKPLDTVSGDVNVVHEVNQPVVRIKDSTYGHTNDYLYDNLDQYVWHELDASTLKSPNLEYDRILDVEKWIEEIPHRRLKAISKSRQTDENWNHWQRCLAWFPMKVVKKTRDATTNYGYTAYDSGNMKRHMKSQNPVSADRRINEPFSTDTMFATTKALGGYTAAQVFCGRTSYYTWVRGMRTESEGPTALRDFIRQVGVPFSLRNDNSKMQTGKAFMDICNVYTIGTETTEPHHPQQNPAENRIGTLKLVANRVMDRSGCPSSLWLRAAVFVSMLLNVIAHRQLNWRTPTEVCFGYTPDISPFLRYEFFEPVYYYDQLQAKEGYPIPKEKLGRWCGPTEHCGSDMTAWILTDDTNELIPAPPLLLPTPILLIYVPFSIALCNLTLPCLPLLPLRGVSLS